MATGTLPINTLTSLTRLLSTTIPVSGGSAWQTEQHTVDLSGYKFVRVFVYVSGAIRNTNWIPVDGMRLYGDDNWTTAYWDSGNLGNVAIDRNGTVNINAKTLNFAFQVIVDGYK